MIRMKFFKFGTFLKKHRTIGLVCIAGALVLGTGAILVNKINPHALKEFSASTAQLVPSAVKSHFAGDAPAPNPTSSPVVSSGSPKPSGQAIAGEKSTTPNTGGSFGSTIVNSNTGVHVVLSYPAIRMPVLTDPAVQISLSNHKDITQPADYSDGDVGVSWISDGTGSNTGEGYMQGYRPMAYRKHPANGDGSRTVSSFVKDHDGNVYNFNYRIDWWADRNLNMTAGQLTRTTSGNNTIFTTSVNFAPTANTTGSALHLYNHASRLFVNEDICDVAHTDTRTSVGGVTTFSYSCTMSAAKLSQIGIPFDIYTFADLAMPWGGVTGYSQMFHVTP